jgi:DNA polymerase I-like protein with 3'-5' exonuclease and polymerase domains
MRELEHRVAPICDEIAAAGMNFDGAAAAKLQRQWTARRAELEAQLRKQFPDTNLNSRPQIGALLEARGWVPESRTEKTKQPKIDDETLESIAALYPEFAGLSEHYILGRRLGQLVNGKKAWTKCVNADGRIHGGIVHIGTPHSRAKHLEPNLAQVPNPKRGKPFATECRSLFKARDGWVLVACDQATLQDRGFAHYLTEFDGGAYGREFLAGMDTHWRTATALGLVNHERNKDSKVDTVIREGSKGFRYAFLYGAGVLRAGQIVAGIIRAAHQLDPASDLPGRFFGGQTHPKESALKRVGKQARDKFEAATPGLRQLRNKLQAFAQRHGWLPGLDGRRVPVRALYSALNFIVTSSEAIICKRWLVRTYDELSAKFRYGWDGDVVLCLWVHDEIVACCRPEIADKVGEIMVRTAREPGEFYRFKVALDADYKITPNWGGDSASVPPAETPSIAPEPADETEARDDAVENHDQGDEAVVIEAPIPGLEEAIADVRAFIAAAASGQLPAAPLEPPPRGNGRAGNGFDRSHDDYQNARAEAHAGNVDKPYGPIRTRLLSQGYRVTKTFPFTVPGEAAPRFYDDRYELKPELTPTKERPRKTSRFWRRVNDKRINGTGPRRVIFNWPAIMQAAPDATVHITEGANKSAALNGAGLIATAALYHQWGPECIAALTGRHLIYHEDHDLPDASGIIKAKEFSAAARQKLSPGAASLRIVPALHLWKSLGQSGEPPHGWDVKDWLEEWIKRGNDPAKLPDICRELPAEGGELDEWDAGELLSSGVPPPRQWLYGRQLCRRFLSSLVAPGDVGKTTKRLTQAVELATGRELLGHRIYRRCRVLVVSLEDDRDELWRRLLAICKHHRVDPAELKGQLFCRDLNGAKLVEEADGQRALGALEPMLRKAIERRQPDLVILDPFVKLHALDENKNPDMDFVCSQLIKLAQDYNIAVDSPAHTRKGQLVAGDSDNRRGASAQRDAGRLDYTLTAMSEAEAEHFGVDPDERKKYVRLDRAKANIVRAIKAAWYRLVNVPIGNATALYPEGDEVQALEIWVPPDAWVDLDAERIIRILDKIDAGMPDGNRYSGARSAKKRAAWPIVVAEVPDKPEAQAREIIKGWLKTGLLISREYENPNDRKKAEGLFVDPAKRPST